jgi:hypothetical protein
LETSILPSDEDTQKKRKVKLVSRPTAQIMPGSNHPGRIAASCLGVRPLEFNSQMGKWEAGL